MDSKSRFCPKTEGKFKMDGTIEVKETGQVAPPVAAGRLNVNVFTAPGKAMVGERPKPFGEALAFDPITSTLIYGENDAVLVDAMTTVAEAEALADWVALHKNIRVADIQACYELWRSRGAEFITEPISKYGEIRCYIRDPDGYIIEVGQSTDDTQG
jgi:hypothetical protein